MSERKAEDSWVKGFLGVWAGGAGYLSVISFLYLLARGDWSIGRDAYFAFVCVPLAWTAKLLFWLFIAGIAVVGGIAVTLTGRVKCVSCAEWCDVDDSYCFDCGEEIPVRTWLQLGLMRITQAFLVLLYIGVGGALVYGYALFVVFAFNSNRHL